MRERALEFDQDRTRKLEAKLYDVFDQENRDEEASSGAFAARRRQYSWHGTRRHSSSVHSNSLNALGERATVPAMRHGAWLAASGHCLLSCSRGASVDLFTPASDGLSVSFVLWRDHGQRMVGGRGSLHRGAAPQFALTRRAYWNPDYCLTSVTQSQRHLRDAGIVLNAIQSLFRFDRNRTFTDTITAQALGPIEGLICGGHQLIWR